MTGGLRSAYNIFGERDENPSHKTVGSRRRTAKVLGGAHARERVRGEALIPPGIRKRVPQQGPAWQRCLRSGQFEGNAELTGRASCQPLHQSTVSVLLILRGKSGS